MNDLFTLSLTELATKIRRRAVSPVEVTRVYLERIERLDPILHAYVERWADEALCLARASEQRVMSGLPVGLLEGVPLALKDLMHVEGRRTGAGSTVYRDRARSTHSATVATRLLGAGAIPLGKAHLVELAYGGWGTNQGLGTPRNPWDPVTHRSPGGSSSGSAVAVAGGLAAGAIGTDTGGSVRIPSAFCGLTGLKTTQARVSNFGFDLVSQTLDTVGPMTWTAEDAGRVLQVIHGPDPLDRATLAVPPQNFLSSLQDSVRGVRFSVVDHAVWGDVDAAIMKGFDAACEVLASLGCVRDDAAFGRIDLVADQQETGVIISSESFATHGDALVRCVEPGDEAARKRVMSGASIDARRYVQAIGKRASRGREFQRGFDRTDLLVLPTLPITARDIASLDEDDLAPSRLTRFVGYYGLCAIALPCGLSPEGLPMSVQLVAAPFREDLLVRVGAAFQKATEYHRLRPSLG